MACVNIFSSVMTDTEVLRIPSLTRLGLKTHELQIMDSTFRILEVLSLTTEPSFYITYM